MGLKKIRELTNDSVIKFTLMKKKLVLLRSGNIILKVLGQFRTFQQAKWFIEDEYSEFIIDVCQWSKFQSPEFITVE